MEVDCRRWSGELRRIWTSFGYDELNWTATPRGRHNLATLHALMEAPYTVRSNLYTSGSGRGLPHWSSGNVYHRKMLSEIQRNLQVIARYVQFRDPPVLVDECDASVPAHWGIYDNANFGYRNTAQRLPHAGSPAGAALARGV